MAGEHILAEQKGHIVMHTYTPQPMSLPRCQPSTPYGIQKIARTSFFKLMVTMTRSNQGHTMTLHTYNP